MTNPDLDDDDQLDDGNDGSEQKYARLPREQLRGIEKKAKLTDKYESENAELRREIALSKVGADLTERQQKALFASIDGDITADSVREAAVELGFVQAPPDTAQAAETEALNRMSQASSGATDPNSEDSVARLERVAREGGREALLAQLQADGHAIATAG